MSNFQPSPETLEKWTYTRKGINEIGRFNHPGIFSTIRINADRSLFFIAFFIEILCVVLATFMSGFHPAFYLTALGLFAVDFILAFVMHKDKQNNICKNRCEFEIANYEIKKRINVDERDPKGIKEAAEASINIIQKKQRFYKVGIILSAVVKIFGFFIINFYGIGILIFVSVLFLFAAYIHIFHTGFYRSFFRFNNAWKENYGKYLSATKRGDATSDFIVREYEEHNLENIPEDIITELTSSFDKIKNDQTRKINKYNNKNLINSTTKTYIVFGQNHNHKIVYDENDNKYYLWTWGIIKDEDLISLITSYGMTDNLKSYIAYEILRKQYYYSRVQKADHQDTRK